MDLQNINQAVESICSTGCTSVKAVIKTLESGNTVDGIEKFSADEITCILHELKSIMAVYENKDN